MKYSRHIAGIEAFGKHLRKVRKRQGFTQEELAYASDMELSQVSRIERGVINTSISHVFKLAEALGVPTKELFDFEWREE